MIEKRDLNERVVAGDLDIYYEQEEVTLGRRE
jgi:hypothetical protein